MSSIIHQIIKFIQYINTCELSYKYFYKALFVTNNFGKDGKGGGEWYFTNGERGA